MNKSFQSHSLINNLLTAGQGRKRREATFAGKYLNMSLNTLSSSTIKTGSVFSRDQS